MLVSPSELIDILKSQGLKLALAESCTGGMIATSITDVPGSSAVLERGYITYSNQSKIDCLGVSKATLANQGAVSAETAKEMATGALNNSQADIALSVTGIAGPDGGTTEKPVGLVYFGLAYKKSKEVKTFEKRFSGDRFDIRSQASNFARFILEKHL
ncbi:MAG: damage-inducible protein CinA [Micavibrio sp.]|nr:damage-inducible protein CinA [Micavibrio sp.]|tara:strand:+ start:1243 stop:1716 length:474 start_codon:yes stop_codon:yes gene_type:complete